MTIREMIARGFHDARTCRSLWVFGFVVGVASTGTGGGGSGGGGSADGSAAGGGGSIGAIPGLPPAALAAIALVVLLVILAAIVARFVSEGALIEGVALTRRGGRMTTREGLRAGWAHWGVLLRIALIYVIAIGASAALLALPVVLTMRAGGLRAGLLAAIPMLVLAVPWLVTLHLVQAFASRIAVLENRFALDAIRKARLFLHGRLAHGLRLTVATFLGSLAFAFATIVAVVPVVLVLVALVPTLRPVPVVVLGCLILLPMIYVLAAMLGTFRSSIWTVGYMTEAEP